MLETIPQAKAVAGGAGFASLSKVLKHVGMS